MISYGSYWLVLVIAIMAAIFITSLGWFAAKDDIRNDCKMLKQFVSKGQTYSCVQILENE